MSAIATAFAPTADAAAYVPYAGAERALASLEEWVCDAERPVLVLRGPEGAGKSMLLSVLAARVGRHAIPVRVSASGLDPESLARQVLDALGTPWEGTPRVALARAIERLDGRRVLLLLDDADVLAPRTEMWLFDFVRRSAGAVHALLAVRDERLASDLAGAFQSGTTVLPIDAPMTREESEVWLRAALARSGAAGELRARFDPPTVARLHERSGGVPGLLRQEAAGLVSDVTGERPAPAAPAPQPPASHHEEAIVTPAPPSPRREVVPHEPAVREALPRREAVPHELARREAAPPALAEPRLRKAARPLGEREHAARGAAAERAHAGHAAASGDPALHERHHPPSDDPFPDEPAPPRAAPREPATPGARAAAPPADDPAPRARVRSAGPATGAPARSGGGADAPPPGDAPRRDSLLRWLLVPVALAAAYVAGFVTSQALEALRSGAPPPALAREAGEALPDVSAAPPAGRAGGAPAGEMRGLDPFRPPAESTAPADATSSREAAAPPPPAGPAAAAPGSPAPAEAPAVAAAPPPAQPELVESEPEPEAAAPAAAEPAARPARRAAPARVARRAPPAEPRPVDVSVEAAPGASILVDGRPVGTGTVEGLQLPAGPHRVEVWLPDGRVVERVVDVRGTRYEVKVR